MQCSHFDEAIRQILTEDDRYDFEAYVFVRQALYYTATSLHKPGTVPERHVTGQELVDGIRHFALAVLGPMALTVLSRWGIRSTEDFGHIVFHMVSKGELRKRDSDSLEDFRDGYDFETAFKDPFLPAGTREHTQS